MPEHSMCNCSRSANFPKLSGIVLVMDGVKPTSKYSRLVNFPNSDGTDPSNLQLPDTLKCNNCDIDPNSEGIDPPSWLSIRFSTAAMMRKRVIKNVVSVLQMR